MDANELAEIRARLAACRFDTERATAEDILARMEWTKHAPADIAALLAEVERLRAALTITPEKVAAAARAGYTEWDENTFDWLTKDWQEDWRAVGLAALRAAGMVEADNGKAL